MSDDKWKGRENPPSSNDELARMTRVHNLEKHVKACLEYKSGIANRLAGAALVGMDTLCLALESQMDACWNDIEDSNREIARLICQGG